MGRKPKSLKVRRVNEAWSETKEAELAAKMKSSIQAAIFTERDLRNLRTTLISIVKIRGEGERPWGRHVN